MSRPLVIDVDGATFEAAPGDRLLDAALVAGAEIPHHCRAGQCGTCRVRVVGGHVLDGRADPSGAVLACQAVVLSDAEIAVERAPPVVAVKGVVAGISELARSVVEVTIATVAPFAWYPGQFARFAFAGFPERSYSMTVALDGADHAGTFRLHIKRVPGGAVSSAIGDAIGIGHRVAIEGPLGAAWLRPGSERRLVLVSGGTGFAPLWAVADAALCERPARPIVVIAGVRSIYDLYMSSALERLARLPNVAVIPLTAEPQSIATAVAQGRPSELAHVIVGDDIVHVAGPPALVEAITAAGSASGATVYADPFVPSGAPASGSRIASLASRFGIAAPGSSPSAPRPRAAVAADASR